VVPFGLYPQYVWSADPRPTDGYLIAGATAVIVLTLGTLWLWRRTRAPAVVWGAYVLTLAPVLSLIRFDRQQFVNDHHSYLATLGVAALLAGLWRHWYGSDSKQALAAAAVGLALLAGLTLRQVRYWRDSRTLWSYSVEGRPLSIIARNNLGRALAAEGDAAGAIEQFRAAVELQPDYAHARYNLGGLLMQQGALSQAEEHFRAAIAREPRFAAALSDLGNCLLRQGRAEEAVEQYRQATTADPSFVTAHFNLALAYQLLGRNAEAIESYRRVTDLDPQDQRAWKGLRDLQQVE
jgi:tetratricopeptide (TPR) repeat protein